MFVDSGGWFALQHSRDRHHEEADRLFRVAAERRVPLLTTNLVLAEVHRLVLFRAGPRVALAMLERMERSTLVKVIHATAAHHAAARTWLERFSDHTITLTDAVSFAVMTAERYRVALAFDTDFVTAGFTLWRI